VPTDHAEEHLMSRAFFKSVSGINCDMRVKPSPVRALEPHVAFYTAGRSKVFSEFVSCSRCPAVC
jgi:hypothetical protein